MLDPAPIRVAIVEDDLSVLRTLIITVAQAPDMLVVGVASTRREGLALLEGVAVDVLLVDLGLPDGSGIDVIRAAATQWPQCNTMVCTHFGDETNVICSIEAGASGYLLKDSTSDKIVEEIRNLAGGGSPISPLIARHVLARFRQAGPDSKLAKASPEMGSSALSAREKEVLSFITKGFTAQEIAKLLALSPFTVRSFIRRIYTKLKVTSKAEAIYEARHQKILEN